MQFNTESNNSFDNRRYEEFRILAETVDLLFQKGLVAKRPLYPKELPVSTSVQVQHFAQQIARYLKLNRELVLGFSRDSSTAAATIKLGNSDGNIYIDINEQALTRPRMLRAAIVHEMTHKFLEVKGEDAGNERLTDITAIVLGMGKYVLNGALHIEHSVETRYAEQVTVTRSTRLGYLGLEDYGFLYLYTCFKQNASLRQILSGLRGNACKCFDLTSMSEWSILRRAHSGKGFFYRMAVIYCWRYRYGVMATILFAAIIISCCVSS